MSRKPPPFIWPLIKRFGGKRYLARRIIELLPTDISTYVEPFLGGGSVFLNLPIEHYRYARLNDLDHSLMCIWDVVHNLPTEFAGNLQTLEYTEACFEQCKKVIAAGQMRAEYFYAVLRMSRGGLGKSFAWSDRTRGGKPGDLNAWENAINNIPTIHDKMIARPIILSAIEARTVIGEYRTDPKAMIYLDPPYVPKTRKTKKAYTHEMTTEQHEDLLNGIVFTNCRIAISGYRCDLYDTMLKSWRRVDFDLPNHSGQNKTKQRRIESLWMNYSEAA